MRERALPQGWTKFWFLPKVLAERLDDDLCEVCKTRVGKDFSIYLVGDQVKELCKDHTPGDAVQLDLKPALIPTGLSLPPSVADSESGNRREAHSRMKQMERQGLTRKQISEELTRLGYQEVSARTVAKHLRGECA